MRWHPAEAAAYQAMGALNQFSPDDMQTIYDRCARALVLCPGGKLRSHRDLRPLARVRVPNCRCYGDPPIPWRVES